MSQEIEKTAVPWTGFDVLLFFALWLAVPLVINTVVNSAIVSEDSLARFVPTAKKVANESDHGHSIAQLILKGKNSPIFLLVAFLAAIVVAPLIEEFLFRLLLQGWLEAKLRQHQVSYASSLSIVAVSLVFATMHGGNSPDLTLQELIYRFVAFTVLYLLIFTLGIVYLVQKRNIKMTRCLFGTQRFFHPRFLPNAGYCLLALLFIYGLKAVLTANFPHTNVDPIPIFCFSLLLGILYSKTQNLSYCILLHACLNGMSWMILFLLFAATG